MEAEFDIQLPSVFPQSDIKVTDESHFYETTLGENETVIEKTEYVLDKAPVYAIVDVTGTAGGRTVEFEQGVDYELSADDNRIVWLSDPATRPDAGTRFFVTYRCESILSRYIGSVEAEFDTTDTNIENVISAKFVDQARGEELDQLGQLFGVLGRRAGRDDPKYRNYLKAVVQAFSSRGKRSDIRQAIAASLSGVTEDTRITTDDVEIIEDFDTTSYQIYLKDWTSHRVSTIHEIGEIVDPSGVDLTTLRYDASTDTAQTADEVGPPNITIFVGENYGFWDNEDWDGLSWGTRYVELTTIGDSQSDTTTTSTLQYERYGIDSWDTMDWDGKQQSDEQTGTRDTINVTVN